MTVQTHTLKIGHPRGEELGLILHLLLSVSGGGLGIGENCQALVAYKVLDVSSGTRHRCWLLNSRNGCVQEKRSALPESVPK